MGTEECSDGPRIPSNTLATLRGILISSLSRENIGDIDIESSLGRRRKVTFEESHKVHGEWCIICSVYTTAGGHGANSCTSHIYNVVWCEGWH
jgi:hypothetical protein